MTIPNLEIERKFLVSKVPDELEKYPHRLILQGYLALDEDTTEVRIRAKDNDYFLTVKKGCGTNRIEEEFNISEEIFERLWPLTKNRNLIKIRYLIPYDSYTIELDIYQSHLAGVITAEVEFPSIEEYEKFTKPDWFGDEISADPYYKNYFLAKNGLPDFLPKSNYITRTNLEEGIDATINTITENPQCRIILVAGGSASGKTSAVAKQLKDHFGKEAVLLSMDNYYHGIDFMKQQRALGNNLTWDDPEAFNFELLNKHLVALLGSQSVAMPIYDYKTATHTGFETVEPVKYIILEGLYALHEEIINNPEVDDFGFKIFVQTGFHGRLIRRLRRDITRSGQDPAEILRWFCNYIEPAHRDKVETTIDKSNLIIVNEFNPLTEKALNQQTQLKFKVTSDNYTHVKDSFNRLTDTTYIEPVRHEDIYILPNGNDLGQTGGYLRVRFYLRDDGSKMSCKFTYKWPRQKEYSTKRGVLEFNIDLDTAITFIKTYGSKTNRVLKDRSFGFCPLCKVHFDKEVTLVKKNKTKSLGNFIEFKPWEEDFSPKELEEFIAKFGFKKEQAITQAYSEM